MAKTLVTGATGFVGSHVARRLCEQGHRVRVLAREASPLDALHELPVEVVHGDLREIGSLEGAVAGCSAVFHVAADYRLWAPDKQELYRSNVEGTENLLCAARAAGVERVVYTSTVGTLRFTRDGRPSAERDRADWKALAGDYKRSKFLAEQAALRHAREGLEVVIVNPSTPVGEGDRRPTESGKMILDFLNRRMPAYLDTGLNLVDVRDVAEGHLLAYEKGRAGERYILGGENMSLKEIFDLLGRLSGLPSPKLRMPYTVARLAAGMDEWLSGIRRTAPRIPLEGVKMARYKMYVRSDKARQELGYNPGPVEAALQRAVDWYGGHGYVQAG